MFVGGNMRPGLGGARRFAHGTALFALALAVVGCGSKEENPSEMPAANSSDGAGTSAPGGKGADPGGGAGSGSKPSAGSGSASTAGSGADPSGKGGTGGPAPMVEEKLDPDVDWTALKLVYPTMYSAFDGEHTFQVPVHVDGVTVELANWSAIPSNAVTFDADPENEGVLVTVVKGVSEITIAARSEKIGGTATLHVTTATPAQWEMGKARYSNGVELDIPDTIDLEMFQAMLLDPNWMPPKPPPDLACNNCHSTGAKYFEVQHTPTQAARFSDDDLRKILTMGQKPAGVGFRVLPEMIFGMTAEEMYAESHRWEASDEEIVGLIAYLRSLTPEGQGDILLPDGTYIAPGETPPGLPMP